VNLADWLDARTGWREAWRSLGAAPIPGGARWSYVCGGLLVFALGLQALTGLLLASFYAPSSTTAWAAVAYIQQEVTLGWLVRGLHSAGASLTVALLGLHLVQVTAWGAYRKPREVNWWLGLMLAGLIGAFALTGYLLPWDQRGYWATQVATSLVGETPLVGPFLRRLVQGGNDFGNLTLTHFYALHTLLLPVLAVVTALAHVKLVRRHGVANPTGTTLSEPFWPRQAARDVIAMALVLACLFAMVVRTHGAPLEAPADPSAAYDARPEWYFLPLYQLLKYFPGALEPIGALGVPLVVVAALALLPLGASRRAALALVLALIVGAVALGTRATLADRRSVGYRRARVRADAAAARALALARAGVPPAGGTAIFDSDPHARARKLFTARCAGCHVLDGEGEPRGPQLTAWSSRAWLRDFLVEPDAPRYFGRTKRLHQMKPVKATGDDLKALVEFVYAQGGSDVDAALARRGEQIFERENCDDCHGTDGKYEGDGAPNLAGRAAPARLEQLIRDAGDGLWFGDRNEMPRFGRDKLGDDDVTALARLIAAEHARSDVTPRQLAEAH
jgi:ubiquinol-cytochrome c reductase cytochrome b subunit